MVSVTVNGLFLLFSNLLAYQPDWKIQPTEVGISDQPRLLTARRRKGTGTEGGTQGATIVFLINTFVAHVSLGKCDAVRRVFVSTAPAFCAEGRRKPR